MLHSTPINASPSCGFQLSPELGQVGVAASPSSPMKKPAAWVTLGARKAAAECLDRRVIRRRIGLAVGLSVAIILAFGTLYIGFVGL